MYRHCMTMCVGNGVIDFEEFSTWMKQNKRFPDVTKDVSDLDQQEMIQLFHIFDKDNDG